MSWKSDFEGSPQPSPGWRECDFKVGDIDRDRLMFVGKEQVLKRNFGFMSILGFSCTILITWEASLIVFSQALVNGGPAGMVYGCIFTWIGTTAIYTSLSELNSMAPTASGQYHWVSMLAPRSTSRFLSYITGWLTATGWQALLASATYLAAVLIQGVAVLLNPDYQPERWHAVLIFFAIILFAIFINAVISNSLPAFEGSILILHILGFFAILIPLIFLAPHADSSDVFDTWSNGGNFPTQGLSFMVGLIGNAWAFAGADGAVHMSEEIKNAAVVVPRSILFSIIINGSLSLAMIIATLYCIEDYNTVKDTPTGFPFMAIFAEATGSLGGASVMISVVIVMQICAIVGQLASSSRMTWSFARDRGLPAWRSISEVHPSTSIPINSVVLTSFISCLLSLITLGSTKAFENLVSISLIGLYASYFLAAGLLLYRRCTGAIREPSDFSGQIFNTEGAQLVWGPWRLRGVFGIFVNGVACAYVLIIIAFSISPTELPVTPANMQYSSVMIGAVIIFSSLWYVGYARKEYKGPVIETTAFDRF